MSLFSLIRIKEFTFLCVIAMLASCGQSTSKNGASKSADSQTADSQTEMNLTSEQEYIEVKQTLDSIFSIVLAEFTTDDEMTKNINTSQNSWILYRDAQLLMKYPETHPLRNGSAFNVCYFSYLSELTKERIETLKPWISGVKEGDVCSGSIKIK